MKIVAAGTFTAPPVLNRLVNGTETENYEPSQILMVDYGCPRGTRPFNISNVRRNDDGSVNIEFAVATARSGTQKYRWLVFGSYMFNRVRIEWLDPYNATIVFYDADGNTTQPPWWWSLVVIRDVPNGEMDKWSIVQTFAPDGTLLPTPPNLLGGATNVGISKPAIKVGGPGYYSIMSDVDMNASAAATVIFYDPQPGDTAEVVLTSVDARQLVMTCSLNGVATNIGPWTMVSYNYSKVMPVDEPSSLLLVNRYATKLSWFRAEDQVFSDRATNTFYLDDTYSSYPPQYIGPNFPSTYLDVWGEGYPAFPGRATFGAKFNLYDSWTAHGPITWNSSNPAVADVATSDLDVAASAGLFRLKAPGTTTITATYKGITSNPVTITVVATRPPPPTPTLESMVINGSASVVKGNIFNLTATGTYSDTSTSNVTNTVTWSIPDSTVLNDMSGTFGKGAFLAFEVGTTTVTVTDPTTLVTSNLVVTVTL